MDDRTDQLLGVVALAVMDRLRAGVATVGEAEAGALVHVRAWPGGSVGDLAGVVGLSQPATVRLVDRLVERGLLRRDAGPDRRTVALVLTEAGSRAAEAVLAARAEALAPLLAGLSPGERGTLERLLGQVTAGLAADRPGAVRVCRLCDRECCTSGPGCPLEHTTRPGGARTRPRG
ncbi:MarR family winged helix-turn-helix transcriptional regulator [Actinomadura rugatobispora]|uniref:MarR family winged helix-turn-helix transcriptional regulator n=1 Tax=Actinomadura rugatobispora TaxID=1994 RepID=A0ABW1A2M4_9ACTN